MKVEERSLYSYLHALFLSSYASSLIPGEQHGFRQAANIQRALDGEYYFYSRIFGFESHFDGPLVGVPLVFLPLIPYSNKPVRYSYRDWRD